MPCSKATNIRESRGRFKEMGQISEMISNWDHLFETPQEQHPKATGQTSNGDDPTGKSPAIISVAPNVNAEVLQRRLQVWAHNEALTLSGASRAVSVRDGFGGRGDGEQREGLRQGLLSHGILSPPSHFLTSYKHSHIPDV